MTPDEDMSPPDPSQGLEPRTDAELTAEDDDLVTSLGGLSRLATGQLVLEDTLTQIATYAVQAVPGADGAGLTLLEHDRADTIVTTAPFVREVDNIQYGLGQGPCISAAAEGTTMLSGSLGGDKRWHKFGSQVARLGVHSVVSLPLVTPDGVFGAMNVYARAKYAFDDRASRLGEMFAAPAAITVQNAQILAQTKRLASQLQSALGGRGVVDRALGIMMSRTGVGEDEALDRLRSRSQTEHVKLAVMAAKIVDEAVRRARARHTQRPSSRG
jgi:GAF domain-containing protein